MFREAKRTFFLLLRHGSGRSIVLVFGPLLLVTLFMREPGQFTNTFPSFQKAVVERRAETPDGVLECLSWTVKSSAVR